MANTRFWSNERICKVSSCHVQRIRRKCIYKKVHYFTFDLDLRLGSRSHEKLSSTFNITWPIHQQSLILLYPTVKEKMHLQANTLFDLDLWVKVTRNVAKCPLHHVTYAPTEFEFTTSKVLGQDAFTKNTIFDTFDLDLGFKVTRNIAQYPLHYVTYLATKFEVATSNRLEGDTFTRKYIIWLLTLTLGSRSHEMLPSTLYFMWHIQLQSLKLLRLTV